MTVAAAQTHSAAFGDYLGSLQALVAQYPDARVMELGGGRKPSFRLDQMPGNIKSYTVNDISAAELALTSDEYDKACFDVTGDVSGFEGQFDVIFSRTLIEHVKDGVKMHENVLKLLKPGGVAFHMAPTLYAMPFIINKFLPEEASQRILFALFPHRGQKKNKFPAYYSWCYGDRNKMKAMLARVGYSRSHIRSFWGHGYYDRVPVARELSRAIASVSARNDWSSLGSYAHITAYK